MPLLERQGFAVTVPTLPSIAHRSAEAATATLDTHVEDLRSLDLRDVVLVGHSYGGMVISVLAEREHARIRKLVYLDTFVPYPQMRVIDYLLPLDRRESRDTHDLLHAATSSCSVGQGCFGCRLVSLK